MFGRASRIGVTGGPIRRFTFAGPQTSRRLTARVTSPRGDYGLPEQANTVEHLIESAFGWVLKAQLCVRGPLQGLRPFQRSRQGNGAVSSDLRRNTGVRKDPWVRSCLHNQANEPQ